jgi:hypothetical protein
MTTPQTMTNRQRFMAVLKSETPDLLPWFPRLEIWYEANRLERTLPERYQGVSLVDIYRKLGMGFHDRDLANCAIFQIQLRGVDVKTEEGEKGIRTIYRTPLGSVSTLLSTTEEMRRKGIRGLEVEHLIKGPEDYAPVEYIIAHTEIIPTYENYLATEANLGEDGIVFPYLGQDPMDRILQELIGYNLAYYHLADYPEKVDHLYQALCEHYLKIQAIALDSPATLLRHGEHFDSFMTPVRIFNKYMLPYFQPFAEKLHARGKYLACHADADSSKLLQSIVDCGFDVADCFVTIPMVPLTIERSRAVFGSKVIIWGGIPSILLEETTSDQEFDDYVLDLFRKIIPANRFILGLADNVMPSSKIERVERVQNMIKDWHRYPCTK